MTRVVIGTALTLALVGCAVAMRHHVHVARWEAKRLLNTLRGYA